MNRCEAPNCKMRTYAPTAEQVKMVKNNFVISFYKFPDDSERRQIWISAANKPSWRPPMFNSSLCSLHFRDDCFNENRELYDNAVPTIFFDDFGYHMREVVAKLDLECKVDDNDATKISKGSGNALNISVESNQSSVQLRTDDDDISCVECEEVFLYDENSKLGIENISIPELQEVTSNSVEKNSDKSLDASPKRSTSRIDFLNRMLFKTPIKSTEFSNKPATVQATPAVSSTPKTFAPLNFPSSISTISSTSSTTSSIITSVDTQSPGISSSHPIVLSSFLTSTQTKSTPKLTQCNSKSNIHPTSRVITILPSLTSVLSKLVTPLSVDASKFSFCEQNTFSIMDPSAESLVVQLLSIVKTANTSDKNKSRAGSFINNYLVTSKSVDVDQSEICEVLPSATIISNVSTYIKAIKDESFVKPKNVSIICGSPAIFLIKNVAVQECDPSMNCVFVITSHNLLPDVYEMKMKSDMSESSNQQHPTQTTQKPLQVSDLITSANPNTGLSIQNTLNTALNTSKTNTVSKPTMVNSSANRFADSICGFGPVRPRTNSNFILVAPKNAVNDSTSNSNVNKTLANSFSYSDPNSQAFNSFSYADSIEPKPCSRISNGAVNKSLPNESNLSAVIKFPANSSNFKVTVTEPLANISSSNTTVTTPSTDSILNAVLIKPLVRTSVNNVTLAKTLTNTVLPKSLVNTSVNNVVLAKPLMSIPISSAVLAKGNTSIDNAALAKPSTTNLNSSPRETDGTAVSIQPTFATSTVSKAPSHANSLQIPKYAQTSTIACPITKTPLSIPVITKTFGSMPDSPLSLVLPSSINTLNTLKSQKSTPVAKISTQLVQGVKAYQLSQPSIYIINHNGPKVQSLELPFRIPTTIPMQTPASSNPAFIHTPLATPAILSKPSPPQATVTKSNVLRNSITTKPKPYTFTADTPAYIFKPIQPSNFDSNLKTYDSFKISQLSTSSIPTKSANKTSLKRKWDKIDDDDDDEGNDPFFASCNDEDYDKEYLKQQHREIENCESNILQKEREIGNLKKKIQLLKKRLNSVRNPNDTKTDEQLVEEILSKYIDSDGVQFFVGQMKVSGKTYTQFRWSEDDKLFALGLLYKNPVEYNVLFQKYTLPSDKTLNKFVNRVKKTEMQDNRNTSGR